jgi:hypothetical protein
LEITDYEINEVLLTTVDKILGFQEYKFRFITALLPEYKGGGKG